MKPATEKKVNEILARAKDLESSYIREIRTLLKKKDYDPEEVEIPRVSAIVIREGNWLLKIVQKFRNRHDLKLKAEEEKLVKDATEFFAEVSEVHSEEVIKNHFIYRLPADFIVHLKRLAKLIIKLDAEVKVQIARIDVDDDIGDDAVAARREIDSEMIH